MDIIRFYKSGRKKLIAYNVTEECKDTWCNSEKTSTGKYFDGFTDRRSYKCQNGVAMYPYMKTKQDAERILANS